MASFPRTSVGTAFLAILLTVLSVGGDARQRGQQGSQGSQGQQGQQNPQGQTASPAAPQQPADQQPQPPPLSPSDPQQPPAFRAGINFVRVDVIVSDKTGNVVGNLEPKDFDVVEDGKTQKIETFKLIKLDGGAAAATKEPPKAIRTDYDEEAEASKDDVRLFSIFLDDYHVRRGASLGAREQLAKFVDTQLGPSDMIGVMYPLESTSSVRMTRNHSAVVRGLMQFQGRKFEYEPKNQFEEQYANYPTEVVERIRNQVSMSAIKGLIIHMGGLKEGRKALILVSEGYTYMLPPQLRNPVATMPGMGNPAANDPSAGDNNLMEDRAQFQADMDLQSDLREIYDTANHNNVAIYTVDPRGLANFEFDINEGVGMRTDSKALNASIDTLRMLAENTDGRAIVNRNDLAAGMTQIVRDTSAYYLIGYSSTQAPSDGKFHEIKVRVKRSGLQVRARKGYWAMTAAESARALAPPKPALPKPVETALAAVSAPSRTRVIRSWIGTSRGENGKTRVTFVWEPIARSPGDAARADVPSRVALMAVGANGDAYFRGRVPDVTLAAAGASSAASATSTSGPKSPSRVTFEVAPGTMQLRVSVEGSSAQVLDSEVRDITIPDLTTPQVALGTPEVFRARTARELQQLKSDVDAVPVAIREFSRTDRLIVRVPAYGPAGAPAITARLLNRGGQSMTDVPVAAGTAPGAASQLELPLAGLAPGEYLVEIKAKGDGGEATELVAFRVTG